MNEQLKVDQQTLVQSWQQELPAFLNSGDSSQVTADNKDQNSIRLHIDVEGHEMYSFDFKCCYVDSREVKVDLVDVEQAGRAIDEHTNEIQELSHDYVRHIHECAQSLQKITNA